jgi:hypothetical protein
MLTNLITPPELPSLFIAKDTALRQNAFAYSNDIPGL